MAGRGEEALERGVRDHECCGVDERMRMDRAGVPQRSIDDEFDRVRGVVHERKQTDRARRDTEMTLQALGRREAQPPGADACTKRVEVNGHIVWNGDEKMARSLLVPQEQVLGLGAGQTWNQ